MTTRPARSILAGALAAGLILAAPVTATAAAPAQVTSSVDYNGTQVPSTKAELKHSAKIPSGVPVYSEPNGSSMSLLLRGTDAAAIGPEVRVSEPFAASHEQWVAVHVPAASHWTDTAKSDLAEPGVAYIRATHATLLADFADGPTGEPTAAPPAVQAYPTKKSDLVTTTHTNISQELFRRPVESNTDALNSPTDKWGSTLKSSTEFTYEGKKWVAVEAPESKVPGGVAYMTSDLATVAPVTAAVTPSVASRAAEAPAAGPVAPAPAPAAQVGPQSNLFADVLSKTIKTLPAVLFAALVMAGTMILTKRRPA